MTPIRHKRGNWYYWLPAKLAHDGKRRAVYFPTRNACYDAIIHTKHDLREHGKSAITEDERAAITLARRELGDLSKLGEVLRHWRLTVPESVIQTTASDAVAKYLDFRATLDLNRRTLRDTKSALHRFVCLRGWQPVHQITVGDLREYLNSKTAGASRRTAYKHLRMFFHWAKDERIVAVNPMESIRPPVDKAREVEVYSVEDFARLLHVADADFKPLAPFLALSGFGMMRSGELVGAYADSPVLRWENVIWARNLVSVPELVAKQTRRAAGNRREFLISDALKHWLEPYAKREGRVADMSDTHLREQMAALFERAGVRKISNGLRKSAISYFIAANREVGVQLAASYAGNSESISRRYYLAWLSKEAGDAWYAIRR